MKSTNSLFQKHRYVLWCLLFMAAYVGYIYYMTHFVLSIAYVRYLTFSMELVSKGVVSYLLGSFVFFMICILIEAGFSTVLLYFLRKWLVRLCQTKADPENLFHFEKICHILLNFFIAVGFVFLLGIKDNFFEMYYVLFESGLDETSVIVERMAYDVEINWIFCDVLVFSMLFDAFFNSDTLAKFFPVSEETPQEAALEEPQAPAQ